MTAIIICLAKTTLDNLKAKPTNPTSFSDHLQAKSLSTAVITQAQAHTQAHEVPRSPSHTKPEPTSPIAHRTTPNLLVVPPDIRKAKVQQIMNLLEREYVQPICPPQIQRGRIVTDFLCLCREALVDATRKRLEKLSGVGLG